MKIVLAFFADMIYNIKLAHPCAAQEVAAPYVHEEVKVMNKYELVYIIDPAVEEDPRKELIARVNELIAQNQGEVAKVDEWGKRRLAYAIDYKTEGYYVLVNFSSAAELPREIERNLGNIDSVIRYQIVRVLDKRSNVKPRPVRVAPIAAPVAAPAVAPEAPVEAPAETPAE